MGTMAPGIRDDTDESAPAMTDRVWEIRGRASGWKSPPSYRERGDWGRSAAAPPEIERRLKPRQQRRKASQTARGFNSTAMSPGPCQGAYFDVAGARPTRRTSRAGRREDSSVFFIGAA